MKYVLSLTTILWIISCSSKINFQGKSSIAITKKDSIENLRYIYLRGFATCQCVYSVPENKTGRDLDISPSIFADYVNFWGVDSLSFLAKEEAKKIKPSTYRDYQNKKPTFIHCYGWTNSPHIDSLIRKYAKASAEEWIRKEEDENQ